MLENLVKFIGEELKTPLLIIGDFHSGLNNNKDRPDGRIRLREQRGKTRLAHFTNGMDGSMKNKTPRLPRLSGDYFHQII